MTTTGAATAPAVHHVLNIDYAGKQPASARDRLRGPTRAISRRSAQPARCPGADSDRRRQRRRERRPDQLDVRRRLARPHLRRTYGTPNLIAQLQQCRPTASAPARSAGTAGRPLGVRRRWEYGVPSYPTARGFLSTHQSTNATSTAPRTTTTASTAQTSQGPALLLTDSTRVTAMGSLPSFPTTTRSRTRAARRETWGRESAPVRPRTNSGPSRFLQL